LPKDRKGLTVLLANEDKSVELLFSSKKNLDLLMGVYGKEITGKKRP